MEDWDTQERIKVQRQAWARRNKTERNSKESERASTLLDKYNMIPGIKNGQGTRSQSKGRDSQGLQQSNSTWTLCPLPGLISFLCWNSKFFISFSNNVLPIFVFESQLLFMFAASNLLRSSRPIRLCTSLAVLSLYDFSFLLSMDLIWVILMLFEAIEWSGWLWRPPFSFFRLELTEHTS